VQTARSARTIDVIEGENLHAPCCRPGVGPTRRGTVPAHLFAYQLAHGVIPRLGWSSAEDAVLCHQCDFAGCANPAHMRLGTTTTNRIEYMARRKNLASPLADVRGAAGRTRAVAAAIRTGLANHEDARSIENGSAPPKSQDFHSPCGDSDNAAAAQHIWNIRGFTGSTGAERGSRPRSVGVECDVAR
jgi:hypothetical protein